MHQPSISIAASLRLQSEEAGVSLSNDAEGNLCVSLEDVSFFSSIPLNKWQAFQLLRQISRRLADPVIIAVNQKKWLSIKRGNLRIHHWGLTFKAIFR
jgi:hypothetical protein